MKKFFCLALGVLVSLGLHAQVSLELAQDQDQFLPAEAMPLAVKITNLSGQPIHLGAATNWLSFAVESVDGYIVIKNAEVPVFGEFDLESSQMGTKRVDLAPYFQMNKAGRYKVIASLRMPEWGATVTSAPRTFDVIHGSKIWTQQFGVSTGTNSLPDVRKYTLKQANYLRAQLRLYVQVSDSDDQRFYHTEPLGPLVSFSQPEAQVDRTSQLHVLWQTGAQSFTYSVVSPDGKVLSQNTYDNLGSRPRLGVNETGGVIVIGGHKRGIPAEIPMVKAPNELPSRPVPPKNNP